MLKLFTGLLAFLWASALFGAEVKYEFVTVDIPTGMLAVPPEDIDDDGTLLTNTGGPFNVILTMDLIPRRGKNRNVSLDCGRDATLGTAISRGRITGFCTDGAFVRQKDGTLIMLSALGKNAIGFGVASDGTVGGQFCTPKEPPNFGCTLHGFTWHPDRGYKTIDYIDGRPGSHTNSNVIAPISNGRVLGEYSVEVNGTNETLEAGYWLYDNGIFDTVSLPRTFEYIGGPGTYITDMNDLGQVVIQRWNIATPHLELYDDGIFYQIAGWPAEWQLIQLNGGNNEGQFTGTYLIQTGVNQFGPTHEIHGFVATPIPERQKQRLANRGK